MKMDHIPGLIKKSFGKRKSFKCLKRKRFPKEALEEILLISQKNSNNQKRQGRNGMGL